MRAVVISYSHHGANLGRAARELGHDVAGAMDPEAAPRQRLAQEFDCPTFAEAGECLDAIKPDVALVSGKHTDIPSYLHACVDRRIPYLVDKPFADNAARLRPAAEATIKRGVFSALTLPDRKRPFIAIVQRMLADGSLGDLLLFGSRLNTRTLARYDSSPSYWHNIPSISGGGCWVVEAAHGIDNFINLVGDSPITAIGGVLSNAMFKRSVEDSAIGILRTANGAVGVIETGYTYPSGKYPSDNFARVVGSRAMVFGLFNADHRRIIEIHTSSGIEVVDDLDHDTLFRGIVADSLEALANGTRPPVSIETAVRILEIQDGVYAFARKSPLTNGPFPTGW